MSEDFVLNGQRIFPEGKFIADRVMNATSMILDSVDEGCTAVASPDLVTALMLSGGLNYDPYAEELVDQFSSEFQGRKIIMDPFRTEKEGLTYEEVRDRLLTFKDEVALYKELGISD